MKFAAIFPAILLLAGCDTLNTLAAAPGAASGAEGLVAKPGIAAEPVAGAAVISKRKASPAPASNSWEPAAGETVVLEHAAKQGRFTYVTTPTIGLGNPTAADFAQSFTMPAAAQVTAVAVQMLLASNVTYVLSLYETSNADIRSARDTGRDGFNNVTNAHLIYHDDALPNHTALGKGQIQTSTIADNASGAQAATWVTFHLDTPQALAANKTYAWGLEATNYPTIMDLTGKAAFGLEITPGYDYAGGVGGYFSTLAPDETGTNSTQWRPTNDDLDACFRIYTRP